MTEPAKHETDELTEWEEPSERDEPSEWDYPSGYPHGFKYLNPELENLRDPSPWWVGPVYGSMAIGGIALFCIGAYFLLSPLFRQLFP